MAMITLLRNLFARKAAPKAARKTNRPTRLGVEALEDRMVMSVTPHGGVILLHVEVQALYLGSGWTTNPAFQQTATTESFLKSVVNSSYMDALTNAGYGVGRGTADQGIIATLNINTSQYLTDSTIQANLQTYINSGNLRTPDANRVYIVFVQPNVAVMNDHDGNSTSIHDFYGYHGAFLGHTAAGVSADIHYAVIAYPGGSVGNATIPGLGAVDTLTEVTSHELAEAVTDPNVNYRALGWYDTQLGEIGDITNLNRVYLNGNVVQRISDQNDQPMTPAGATPFRAAAFVLQTGGTLKEITAAGTATIFTGVARVSDQGIDAYGRAMVDFVTTDGRAFEYHDGAGWIQLTTGVVDAKAGQGVSYVLLNDGRLFEYHDATGGGPASWSPQPISYNVTAIDAGTDRKGVNMVDVILRDGTAWQVSDTSGWKFLGSGVKAVSAGQQGFSEVLHTNSEAFEYLDSTGALNHLAYNVAQITVGTDASGGHMVDLLYNNRNAIEWRAGTWSNLGTGVGWLSKAHYGREEVVFADGTADEITPAGRGFLASLALEAV
jgi:hypothetical protein